MKTLTQKTIDKIESKGLVLFGKKRDLVMVSKPLSTIGNCIEWKITKPFVELENIENELVPKKEQFETDAPVLGVFIEPTGFRIEVWQWVPGPGPGDFEKLVSSEEEVYENIVNYFFENNEYFEAYKEYELKNKN